MNWLIFSSNMSRGLRVEKTSRCIVSVSYPMFKSSFKRRESIATTSNGKGTIPFQLELVKTLSLLNRLLQIGQLGFLVWKRNPYPNKRNGLKFLKHGEDYFSTPQLLRPFVSIQRLVRIGRSTIFALNLNASLLESQGYDFQNLSLRLL